MSKVLVAVIALSLAGIGVADAKSKKKKIVRHHAPVAAYVPASPYPIYQNRPIWAAPWQCFTDEGYGRFRPCDAGPTSPR